MTFVSVIVPVYNTPDGLEQLIKALLNQSFPSDSYEIIIVDNGSTDGTLQLAQKFQLEYPDRIKLLVENQIQNSYVARNKGLEYAKGDIIAFIDADCVPVSTWLESGVNALNTKQAELVGGKVSFTFSDEKTSSEIFDSLIHLNVENYIKTLGSTITANLFVQRRVFDVIGPFPKNSRSGGDMIWTKWATQQGYKLVYSPYSEVFHPARKIIPLLKKMFRVGYGHIPIWTNQGVSLYQLVLWSINDLKPLRIRTLREMIENRGTPDMSEKLFSIWIVAWLSRIVMVFGRMMFAIEKIRS